MIIEYIQKLHKEAMDLAEKASVARLKDDLKNAENLLREAYKKESDSAKMLVDEYDFEPTRSILFRSAASLAMECNRLLSAERLIGFGLSGNPPEEIAEELRSLQKANMEIMPNFMIPYAILLTYDSRRAKELVAHGLSRDPPVRVADGLMFRRLSLFNNPPEEIAEELRDLLHDEKLDDEKDKWPTREKAKREKVKKVG